MSSVLSGATSGVAPARPKCLALRTYMYIVYMCIWVIGTAS